MAMCDIDKIGDKSQLSTSFYGSLLGCSFYSRNKRSLTVACHDNKVQMDWLYAHIIVGIEKIRVKSRALSLASDMKFPQTLTISSENASVDSTENKSLQEAKI